MPSGVEPQNRRPTRGRAIIAGVAVLVTVVCVWKFIDYRNQPPVPPAQKVNSDR